MGKLEKFAADSHWQRLSDTHKEIISSLDSDLQFSHAELRQLIDIARDLEMWDEPHLSPALPEGDLTLKQKRQKVMKLFRTSWEQLKTEPNNYEDFTPKSDFIPPHPVEMENNERTILGSCPVASPKTRCCNLQTLDSVISCGHDCSYCSIQSFYTGGKVQFDTNLKEKLNELSFDPAKRYHIGTGQSSDSLMWGNREGNLEHMIEFARRNPNIVLEFKTKSKNITWLLENDIPSNVICTWSLNPQEIIDNEEHLTASLEERLTAAEKMAAKGVLVGFHFHPMVYYSDWENGYREVVQKIMKRFTPKQVITISLGTLTFIKPVIKKLRNRDFRTKILQMPLVDAEGKHSYPYEIKRKLFSHVYNEFKEWHDQVYFYMCMEDIRLWNHVFGFEYSDNEEFENAMISSYFSKIEKL